MHPLTRIFFSLSLLWILASCATPAGCLKKESSPTDIPAILTLPDEKPVLYRAQFGFLKYHFSGLVAFRKMEELQEIRIAFVSEVGLKIMEYRYTAEGIENTYCMPAIYRKSMVKFVGQYLNMILRSPGNGYCCPPEKSPESTNICRADKKDIVLSSLEENGLQRQFSSSRKKQIRAIYKESENIPDTIWVTMKYNTNIEMKLVGNAFK
jgi:hypothetical protein